MPRLHLKAWPISFRPSFKHFIVILFPKKAQLLVPERPHQRDLQGRVLESQPSSSFSSSLFLSQYLYPPQTTLVVEKASFMNLLHYSALSEEVLIIAKRLPFWSSSWLAYEPATAFLLQCHSAQLQLHSERRLKFYACFDKIRLSYVSCEGLG